MRKLAFLPLPLALLFIQPIFMASNLVVARGGVEYVPPISLSFWRWLLVFLVLFIFNFNSLNNRFHTIKRELKRLFFLGFTGCGISSVFPYTAGETTTIVNIGIIYTSSPIFIILISYFFFKEKISKIKITGLISCMIGVLIIICNGKLSLLLNLKFTPGDLWALGGSIGWAFYSVYLYNWKSKLGIFPRFTLISLFGFISILPFYLAEEVFIQPTSFDKNFFIWIIFAAILPGIISFSLYTMTQKYLGASTTGFTLYLFTVYGAFYGIVFFGEHLEIYHYFGTILVFFGIYLVKKRTHL